MTTAANHKISPESSQEEVCFSIEGNAGVITLNRPSALNTLNLSMIRKITSALIDWSTDNRVKLVLVEGSGDKSFCAGGDIKSVYLARLEENMTPEEKLQLTHHQGGRHYMDAIFREEYQMNYLISQYPKPYVSLIHGICMGGGMGLSIHGSHRVVREDTVMSMPETSIGFFTDVGASYFLNQLPGKIGMFMGLTGARLNMGDCLYTGLATHYVPGAQWSQLRELLLEAKGRSDVSQILDNLCLAGIPSDLSDSQEEINRHFSGSSMEEIIKVLEKSELPQAYEWLKLIDKKSPTSLKIIHALLHKGARYVLKKCLAMEFRLSQRFVENYDLFEGVRSVLIDKDNKPQWQPNRLMDIRPARLKYYFSPLVDRPELELKDWQEL